MTRARWAGVALAGAALMATGTTPARAQQDCVAKQVVKKTSYESRVCDVPDYDQRRRAGTIAGKKDTRRFTLTGLLDDGGCHCVPTSLTDLLGYYAQKGVDIPPGRFGWRVRPAFDEVNRYGGAYNHHDSPGLYLDSQPYSTDEVFAYNDATNLIAKLGTSVKSTDDTCGTTYEAVVASFDKLVNAGRFKNAGLGFGITETGERSGRSIASVMHNGGLVSVAYGNYTGYERNGTKVNVDDREGGHAIAVAGISGNDQTMTLSYNDPSNTSDLFRNARFRTFGRGLLRLEDDVGLGNDWYYRFGGDASGTTQRLIDKYMAVYPHYLIAGKGSTAKVVYGFNLNRSSGAAVSRAGRPGPSTETFSTKGRLIDAVPLPMSGEVAYIEEGSNDVKAIVPGTDQVRRLGTAPAGRLDLDANPTGSRIFALGKTSVATFSRDGGLLEKAKLSEPATALAYDWATDAPYKQRLAVLSQKSRRLTLLDPESLKATDRSRLPRSLLAGRGELTAGFDEAGRLQLRRGDGAIRTRGAGASKPAGAREGFATTDDGTLVTVRSGKIEAKALPFDGAGVGGARVLAVSHSGGDYTRAQADEMIDETSRADGPDITDPDEFGPPTPVPTPTPSASPTATPVPTPSATPTPTPDPRPNLIVAAVDGRSATIHNEGASGAGPFGVRLTRGSVDPPLEFNIGGLAAGASTTITYDCRRSEIRTLTVDFSNSVDEFNEEDNMAQFGSSCTAPRRG